jgi:hypothetical protein
MHIRMEKAVFKDLPEEGVGSEAHDGAWVMADFSQPFAVVDAVTVNTFER